MLVSADWAEARLREADIISVTALFFVLVLLAATQDIAVDGWALTLLSRQHIGCVLTLQLQSLSVITATLLPATQDSAVDDWAFTLLSGQHLGCAPHMSNLILPERCLEHMACLMHKLRPHTQRCIDVYRGARLCCPHEGCSVSRQFHLSVMHSRQLMSQKCCPVADMPRPARQ